MLHGKRHRCRTVLPIRHSPRASLLEGGGIAADGAAEDELSPRVGVLALQRALAGQLLAQRPGRALGQAAGALLLGAVARAVMARVAEVRRAARRRKRQREKSMHNGRMIL